MASDVDSDCDSNADPDPEEQQRLEEEYEKSLALRASGSRRSVFCGESGTVDAGWEPVVHPKDKRQREVIVLAVLGSFLFSGLRPETTNKTVDAFKGPVHVKAGATIIREGSLVTGNEPGIFVLEKGCLDAFKAKAGVPSPGSWLCSYKRSGQVFGDLALLYNCPRAASVVAKEDSVLWTLDRNTFNNCVKGNNIQNRAKLERFLASVEILNSLTDEDRHKICDVILQKEYLPGDRIIRAGDDGSGFFLVMRGSAQAREKGKPIQDYSAGDYFGELALLANQPRSVDVYAGEAEGATMAVLDSTSFKRLLGPLGDLMNERAKKYQPLASASSSSPKAPAVVQAAAGHPQLEQQVARSPATHEQQPLSMQSQPAELKATEPTEFPFGWLCCSCGVSPPVKLEVPRNGTHVGVSHHRV